MSTPKWPPYDPEDPFRDAVRVLAGTEPPDYVRGWSSADLTDEDVVALGDWLGLEHCQRHLPWATGTGLIEAAEHLVDSALENGNLWALNDSRRATEGGES